MTSRELAALQETLRAEGEGATQAADEYAHTIGGVCDILRPLMANLDALMASFEEPAG